MLSAGFMLIGGDVKLNSPSSLIGQALTEILQHPERARDALRVLLHLVRGPGAPPPGFSWSKSRWKCTRRGRPKGFPWHQERACCPQASVGQAVGPSSGHDVRCHTDGCSPPCQDPGGGSRGVTWSKRPQPLLGHVALDR